MNEFQREQARSDARARQATALWVVGEREVELRREALRAPGEDELLIESRFGAISRGTEAIVHEGRVPTGETERMRGPCQAGDFPFPVKYGYAVVGRVTEGPSELCGRYVFCLHPHQDRFVVPLSDVVPLPDDVPPERAVLAANMETALNIVWDGEAAPCERICVVGGGLVGLLVATLAAKLPGADVTLVDIDPARCETAAALGLRCALPQDAPKDCDLVVHTSASEAGLATALGAAGFEARVVEASWYADRAVQLWLGEAFHSRRLRLISSQVGAVPPGRRARWSRRRRLEAALALLTEQRLDVLFSGETPFSELVGAYGGILAAPGTLCHRIRYETL
ncbi:zinc-dependent alcohol dehydrogenase [Aureimonas mangrovi]|uniref:zinc-dependent alcohol dehydrogenase n=1 Tax=Aureimonas mangrovi TaxID=2758041 RepID=UPI00163DC21F|nr:zinc-binding alcohol dehydrogenase [Aureimonas mangrovi]